MLVKVNLAEDIRRFTIDHPFLSFSGLENQLANLYKLPQKSFKVFYTDNEGDRVLLSSNEELNAALSYAAEQSNVLRLTIELGSQRTRNEKKTLVQSTVSQFSSSEDFPLAKATAVNTGTDALPLVAPKSSFATNTQPIITSSSSTNTNPIVQTTSSTNIEISTSSIGINTSSEDRLGKVIDELDMDELLAHPKFQEKLSVILTHAISTQAFSQLLQSMLPQMRDILKESIAASKGNEIHSNSTKIELSPITSSASDFSNPPIVPLVATIDGSVEFKSSLQEKKSNSLSSLSSSSPVTNEQVLFTKEKPETISDFTIITEEAKKSEKEHKPATPLFDSFLSLFKSNNNSNNSNSNNAVNPTPKKTADAPIKNQESPESEEVVVIPNLEELLSQLEAMGFHNREQNIKVLRFHKKFNEGLDEVVEDLLKQDK